MLQCAGHSETVLLNVRAGSGPDQKYFRNRHLFVTLMASNLLFISNPLAHSSHSQDTTKKADIIIYMSMIGHLDLFT